MIRITLRNIEQYRGGLKIGPDDLKCGIWDVFAKDAFEKAGNKAVVPLTQIVSTKDQLVDSKFLAGLKDDPRQVALMHMQAAAANKGGRRGPIEAYPQDDGLYYVVDGNATVQVLMMTLWSEVPVVLVERPHETGEISVPAAGDS